MSIVGYKKKKTVPDRISFRRLSILSFQNQTRRYDVRVIDDCQPGDLVVVTNRVKIERVPARTRPADRVRVSFVLGYARALVQSLIQVRGFHLEVAARK